MPTEIACVDGVDAWLALEICGGGGGGGAAVAVGGVERMRRGGLHDPTRRRP